ncbi:HNH endonuclease [Pseudomonas sp. HMWF021]|uniref:HNH endonuclease n=1 Tax=Pseudomonas sp. HMWF021 TaxID=2056857 RepID=UPI000D3C9D70|nr:HNH endonuclease [Pseudomonas sp. HMWF021]PTT27376.1 HNH endonuclease [Pseudomonas sp. HMWF021]
MDTEKENSGWTDEELGASVDGYLDIQARYPNDQKFNKSLEHKRLQNGVLAGRNTKSIDYRLQNITALFEDLGLKTISSYKPKVNLGSGITARLIKILESKGLITLDSGTPSTQEESSLRNVQRAKQRDFVSEPEGVQIPQQIVRTTKTYARISKVKDWILFNAKGFCEGCGQPGPFEMNGEPYLEVHHVKHLSDNGTDFKTNTVALCPNCHRRCHHSDDREAFTAWLYDNVGRLEKE